MKIITFYLPQFHPIEENNKWWGIGFTEWTNVAKARPRFRGHYQPHLPADIGFYDLRCPETRELQIKLAKSYGIDAFCYYHYWFQGRRILNRPFDDMLASSSPEFPFCLCWANESWTRSWDGKTGEILIQQKYSMEDNQAHIDWLLQVFNDKRYLKINGKPIFIIYRTDSIPNISELLSLWQEKAIKAGYPGIYFCAVRSNFNNLSDETSISNGFSAIIDFQPSIKDFPNRKIFLRSISYINKIISVYFSKIFSNSNYYYTTIRIPYKSLMKNSLYRLNKTTYKIFPCVIPNWDNSPRKKNSIVIQNDNTVNYGKWLDAACQFTLDRYPPEERIVFINAWNEWGESAHLEPDLKNGLKFLETTKKIIEKYKKTDD